MNKKAICQVLLPAPFNFGFSYFAPDDLALEIGDVVKVSFGSKNLFGVVIGFNQENEVDEKKIKTVISKEERTRFSPKLLEFIDWVSSYNLAPKGLVLKLALSILNSSKEPKKKIGWGKSDLNIKLKSLSNDQQKAADFLLQKIDEQKFSTILLDGATGTGKTEIYFSAIAKILQKFPDGQILILLPEIALTSQLCKRFSSQFGFEPDLWHSKISPAKKRVLFFRIADGSCRVLIGARSALFLPFKNLQLIVVDEEHDASFKQEDVVNYNGRDMAITRAKIENFPVILSSATPSLESYLNAKNGKYELITLRQRFGQEEKTEIELVDMRKEKLGKNQFISSELKKLLQENLENNRQSLLFLNRRGYAPLTLCKKCGERISCNNCSSHLTLHKRTNRLTCHHCGLSRKMVDICQNCGEKDCLTNCGVGIEKLQEEVLKYFPEAKIGLMTSDHITSTKEAEDLIDKILEHKIDIIIGTQMIAKGHHFPSLALVGIVEGDASFLGGNLRTAERSYQLLTQVIGRAGREHFAGKVILQTYNPQNSVFEKIIAGKQEEFLEDEIKNRKALDFPPFSKMASIIFSGTNEEEVIKTAKIVLQKFLPHQEVEVFGPAPLAIVRVKNRFQYCLNIKVEKKINLQKLLIEILKNCETPAKIRVKIDIDPL
ncbi:MAG: primosome assembly protein PriA [Rickettsiaceae bacterium]|jgi:primosomal protein N' (replication factor Y)|nr:primosome assembly protein PriA [Rickettsiaceae bacterium]